MGIAWLWHFTQHEDASRLRALNEARSASVYATWRALLGWSTARTERLRGRWQERRRARAARRELDRLSDHMLRDIGVLRDAAEVALSTPYRAAASASPPTATILRLPVAGPDTPQATRALRAEPRAGVGPRAA